MLRSRCALPTGPEARNDHRRDDREQKERATKGQNRRSRRQRQSQHDAAGGQEGD